jgi:hypothetical protein
VPGNGIQRGAHDEMLLLCGDRGQLRVVHGDVHHHLVGIDLHPDQHPG